MSAPQVRAVIFDWGGTLTPWHTIDLEEQWRVYAHVAHPERAAEVAAAILAAEREAWGRTRTDCTSASLAALLEGLGLAPHAAALAAYEEFWAPHTLTDPAVGPLFTALRSRGLKIGVLSNTIWTRAYHDAVFARDGVLGLIDGAVYSSEIPWTKPHPGAFRAALDAVGVDDPQQAVFVGDRLFDDIHGAARVGLRTVFVPHSDIPTDQRGHVDGEPDAVVQSLGEVLGVVERWHAQAA